MEYQQFGKGPLESPSGGLMSYYFHFSDLLYFDQSNQPHFSPLKGLGDQSSEYQIMDWGQENVGSEIKFLIDSVHWAEVHKDRKHMFPPELMTKIFIPRLAKFLGHPWYVNDYALCNMLDMFNYDEDFYFSNSFYYN